MERKKENELKRPKMRVYFRIFWRAKRAEQNFNPRFTRKKKHCERPPSDGTTEGEVRASVFPTPVWNFSTVVFNRFFGPKINFAKTSKI